MNKTHIKNSQPQEIASDIYVLEVGKGIMRSNVYFIRTGSSWVLIDAATANCEQVIQEAADSLFGTNTCPALILLTHDHPDHAGSVLELARKWDCSVYIHPNELPLVDIDFEGVKKYANSLDNWLVIPMLRLIPRHRRDAMIAKSNFKEVVSILEPDSRIPGLPDWEAIPTPGHTPGHVSFFRSSDRVLITGDAILTADLNSLPKFVLWGMQRNKQQIAGPPQYSTWDWKVAKKSVMLLSTFEPYVLASGHGFPMIGPEIPQQVHTFARLFCGHD
jgi:glyoxylase-like metal-dependent hydrolase (beta-lactamase superfamily II)